MKASQYVKYTQETTRISPYLEPSHERNDRISQLWSDRPDIRPKLRQALADSLNLALGRCQIKLHRQRVAVFRVQRRRIVVSVHSRFGVPQKGVVCGLDGRRIGQVAYRQLVIAQRFGKVGTGEQCLVTFP